MKTTKVHHNVPKSKNTYIYRKKKTAMMMTWKKREENEKMKKLQIKASRTCPFYPERKNHPYKWHIRDLVHLVYS